MMNLKFTSLLNISTISIFLFRGKDKRVKVPVPISLTSADETEG